MLKKAVTKDPIKSLAKKGFSIICSRFGSLLWRFSVTVSIFFSGPKSGIFEVFPCPVLYSYDVNTAIAVRFSYFILIIAPFYSFFYLFCRSVLHTKKVKYQRTCITMNHRITYHLFGKEKSKS